MGSRLIGLALLVAGALVMVTPASGAWSADGPDVSPASLSAGSGPVSVAVVMPLTVPPTTTGLLDADALTTYTRAGGLLDRQLDAVVGTAAAIGLDPMIPASIRVLGSSAPADALDFLARLRSVPNDVFLLGYADADPALAAVAGTAESLTPLGFDFAIDPANFGPAVTPSPTPTSGSTGSADPPSSATAPADDGSPPPLPTTKDLLAWSTTLPAIAWPSEGSVTDEGLAGLVAQEFADVLLSGANASPTATALVDLGDINGLIVNDDLTDAVRDAVYAPTETEYQAASVTLAAALRAADITAPGRTLIATLDRRWPFGTPRLSTVLSAIELDPASQLVTLGAVLNGPKGSASLVPPADDVDAARATTLGTLAAAADAERRYLSIAETPGVITQPRRLALLGLSAVGWRVDPVGWKASTAQALTDAKATLAAVQITDGSDQLVLSDISSLRLHVSNALPVAVTVNLVVSPLRPLLHVEDSSVEVTIEPDSTSTASVPVSSISNGEVTVRAELRGPTGRSVGDPRFLKVILQAGWETVGTLVAGSLVVLIFGGGLIRVVLRRRRERAEPSGAKPSGNDD
ncbi:hypothetical protein BH09ACT4_BH09ACT4_05560 [soil metagenome]